MRAGLAWWGQAEEEVASRVGKQCFFGIPLDSHDLGSSLEVTGTVQRTLMGLPGSRMHWVGGLYGQPFAGWRLRSSNCQVCGAITLQYIGTG